MVREKLLELSMAFLLLSLLLIPSISALCNNGQIDINTASLKELDKLSGIGPAKAQAIINTRPFSSVDDLIRVNGIGNVILNGIKTQGLACVENEVEGEEKTEDKNVEEDNNKTIVNSNIIQNNINDNIYYNNEVAGNSQDTTQKIIRLNYPANDTKDIKTEENSEILNKDKIATYGFFVFGVLIGILLIIRRKKTKENDI